MKWLRFFAEHRSHSAGSALANVGGGSGGGPRSDPSDAELMSMTVGIAILRCPDSDVLNNWVELETGRHDAGGRIDEAPVYGEALEYVETEAEKLERTRRFRMAITWLGQDLGSRFDREAAALRCLGYDI